MPATFLTQDIWAQIVKDSLQVNYVSVLGNLKAFMIQSKYWTESIVMLYTFRIIKTLLWLRRKSIMILNKFDQNLDDCCLWAAVTNISLIFQVDLGCIEIVLMQGIVLSPYEIYIVHSLLALLIEQSLSSFKELL